MATAPRRLRVFIGPTEVAGTYGRLAGALRDIGVDAEFVDLYGHVFRYGGSLTTGLLPRLVARLISRRHRSNGGIALALFVPEFVARLALVLWMARRFDVFVYVFGLSVLREADFVILRLLRKRLIFMFNGSDSRPPYMDGPSLAFGAWQDASYLSHRTRDRKARMRRIERLGSAILCNPLSGQLFESPFISVVALGRVFEGSASSDHSGPDVGTPGGRQRLRVLHAPSKPHIKGSDAIRQAIDTLRQQGLDLDYVELVGVPFAEVAHRLESTDFVIDQLYSDLAFSSFAHEAAWYGKPAVVSGYGWAEMDRLIPADQMPPVARCEPDTLAVTIRRVAEDQAFRTELGRKAKSFVDERWAPEVVARRFETVLRNEPVDPSWVVHPETSRYVWGCGVDEETVRSATRQMIEKFGLRSLGLYDKPDLEAAVIRAVGLGESTD